MKKIRFFVSLMCLATWSQASLAAELDTGAPGGAATELEVVVVTAEKRSGRVQDIPASISALSTDQLATRGVRDTLSIAQSTPGLTFGKTASWTNLYMRGIGNTYLSPAAQSAVAIYVDGVYYADVASVNFGLVDVDRVEILKGPQGALYGRNAVGGAINVITKTPSQGFDADLTATLGNFSDREVNAYVSGGNEKVQGSVNINRSLADGYYRNIAPGSPDLMTKDDFSVHGKLRFTPSDAFEATIAGDYLLQKPYTPTANEPSVELISPSAYLGRVVATQTFLGGYSSDVAREVDQPKIPYTRTKSDGGSITARYHADGFDVVSITAARSFSNKDGTDDSNGSLNIVNLKFNDYHNQQSQELQLISTGQSNLSWIGGLYYLHESAGITPFRINQFAEFPPIGGVYIDINSKIRSKSYAGYGQVTYKYDSKWSLAVGARYSIDQLERTAARQTVTTGPFFVGLPPGFVLSDINSPGATKTYGSFTPSATLEYERPEGIYYVTVSKGYSSGLFNLLSIAPTAAQDLPVKPQKVNAVEAGAKWTLLDRRLVLNIAGFYYKLSNLQLLSPAGGGLTAFENADGKSEGADADFTWRAAPRLTLRGGMEYLHAVYTSYGQATTWTPNLQQGNFGAPPCGGQPNATPFDANCKLQADLSGQPMLRSPKISSTLGANWDLPIIPEAVGRLTFSGEWYRSSSFRTISNGNVTSPAYDSFNTSLMFSPPSRRWDIRLWGNNVTSAKYYLAGNEDNYGRAILFNPPATYGATVDVRF